MNPDDKGMLRQVVERTVRAARACDEQYVGDLCDELVRWVLAREHRTRSDVLMSRYWPQPPVARDLRELCQAYDDICNAPVPLLRER